MFELNTIKKQMALPVEVRTKEKENRFYTSYNEINEGYQKSPNSEVQQQYYKAAEKAKKLYEKGEITIDQACQAIGVYAPHFAYDPDFTLPE